MRKNNFSISLPQSKIDQVIQMSAPGETPGLTIKRLLLQVLDDGTPPDSGAAPDPDELEYLQHQVERLEERLGICPDPAGADRLDKLEERLTELEEVLYKKSPAPVVDPLPNSPTKLPKATKRKSPETADA
jgi:hypothetical protein